MSNNTNGAILTSESITAIVDGNQYTVTRDNVNFTKALEAASEQRWDDLVEILSPVTVLINFGNGRVTIKDGQVLYMGDVVHNVLATRMLEMAQTGFNVEPMANFLDNLHSNPSKQAVDELYLFLEANNLAITPDGHFLAYKRVTEDYMDIHSRSMNNSVGQVVTMPRNKVDDVRANTCSEGLHFCSLEYLPHFGSLSRGDRTVIVKINPADVVSIPQDYNNAKGRTCRYQVVAEHDSDTESAFDEPVVDYSPEEEAKELGDSFFEFLEGLTD